MMVKEHFIETYGPVAHTIGWGGSGGAIQQYASPTTTPASWTASSRAVVPRPDHGGPVADCRLLDRYFAGRGAALHPEQQRGRCPGYGSSAVRPGTVVRQPRNADRGLPAGDPGRPLRPGDQPGRHQVHAAAEQLVNQLGRDPATGFVRRPLDNIGVQYGLAALEAGHDHAGAVRRPQRAASAATT